MTPFPISIKVENLQVELDELERSWVCGELEELREIVMGFIRKNLDRLCVESGVALGLQVQNLIMDYVSLDIQSELKDQAHEISKAVWYAGEQGHHYPESVRSEWIFNHAENWRSWRIKEYLYVAYKSEAEIASLLD